MIYRSRLFLLLSALVFIIAGASHNDALQSLLDSEKSFMQMAKDKNTRDAFLFYLSDQAVTAEPGKGPRRGKAHLESQEPNESWLYWYPALSEVASSGDFGYNSGPWEFRVNRDDADPVAFGQFLSVWRKEATGQWKVLLDMGISHSKPSAPDTLRTYEPENRNKSSASKEELVRVEQAFIDALAQRENYAYDEELALRFRFLRPGHEPLIERAHVHNLIQGRGSVRYVLQGEGIASSGDLGYVYGKAMATSPDGAQTTHSYVRIWKRESGKWRIAVDLLSD